MRKLYKLVAGVLIAILLTVVAQAVDWSNRYSFGVRGPVIIPLTKGTDYKAFKGYEPYRMGWDATLDFRHGFSKNVVFGFSMGFAKTWDDTTATSNQSLKLLNKDNAYTRLNSVMAGFTGQYYFWPESNIQPYFLAGVGIDFWKMTVLAARSQYGPAIAGSKYRFSDFDLKVGAGFNFQFSEKLALDLQGRISFGITNLTTTDRPLIYGRASVWNERPFKSYFEPSVGLTYQIGGASDKDKDGIKDKFDVCTDTPLGAIVDKYGCPLDSDGDGVYDGLDLCPDTPKGAIVDITGCPLDTDKDGVFDGLDKCPDTPPGAKVDKKGCPLDGDGDGVPDYKDKQPNTPRGAKVDQDGVGIDSDHDGVYDGLDKCPTTEPGVQVDSVGCPINVKPPVQKITLNIKYATGSYEPDQASGKILDDLALTMKAYIGARIEISGYTDDVGSDTSNMVLSRKRAEAVMEYLKNKGVEPDKMTALGFGESPSFFVADNKTPAGRQQNRRVEIISIQK